MNAPGRGKLKVTGIIYIVFGALALLGALMSFGGSALLAGAGGGYGTTAVGALVGVLGLLTAVNAALYLVLGILGVKNCDAPEKCGVNFVLGVIVLVLVVIGMISTMITVGFAAALTSVVGLVLAIIYLMGAKQNRDAAKVVH